LSTALKSVSAQFDHGERGHIVPTYELLNAKNEVLLLAEAADSGDATLWGYRNLPGFHHALPASESAGSGLEDAYRRLGESFGYGGELLEAFVRGRPGSEPSLRTVTIPRQEATDRGGTGSAGLDRLFERPKPKLKPLPTSAREVELREPLRERSAQESLKESFMMLGLSPEAAELASRVR
jgi:hypothetical protein